MTGQQITPAVRAALDVARRATAGPEAPHGLAETIVLTLSGMGLLQTPETAAELVRLRQERAALNGVLAGADEERGLLRARVDELAAYEVLHPQECTAQQHRQWFADVEAEVPCPWCEIAQLQAGRGEVYRALQDGVELAEYATAAAAGAHCESILRRQFPGAVCQWIASADVPGLLDLVTHHGSHTSATDLAVLPVQIYASYDAPAPAVTG